MHISGGIIRSHTGTIIGSEAADYFRSLKQVEYAFIGCDAIDLRGEVYSDNISVAAAEKTILLSAKHKYILCDPSKIGKTAVAHITSLSVCDGLITSRSASDAAEGFYGDVKIIYA